jgi:hypothetical protein
MVSDVKDSMHSSVGKGHRGKEAISTFFDRNIAPSGRKFEIKDSFACGQEVANVGTIHLFWPRVGKAGVTGCFCTRSMRRGRSFLSRLFGNGTGCWPPSSSLHPSAPQPREGRAHDAEDRRIRCRR